MKNNLLLIVPALFILFSVPVLSFSQTPVLGEAGKYALFSASGAIGNTQRSFLTGEVGTNTGAVTGFGNVDGIVHTIPDGSTQTAANDLITANTYITVLTSTGTHAPAFGTETITPGIYDVGGNATLNGTLTLDGGGNAGALFIFRITGTYAVSIPSVIVLTNGAVACNVFWKVGGVINLNGGITKGTFMNGAAINMSPGVNLEGRALSSVGAVNVSQVTVVTPLGCGVAPLTGPAAPNLLTTKNFGLFTASGAMSNSGTSRITGDVGSNTDNPSGFNAQDVNGMIHLLPDNATAQASTDLTLVYNNLNGRTADIQLLLPADLGYGIVLTPHTYLLNAATVLTDTLFLNAQGDANATFILKVTGAFATGTKAVVMLINGAQAKNVYWKIDGAVDIGVESKFAGTIVVAAGAIALRTDVVLAGRGLTMAGAVSAASSRTTMYPDGTLPVTWLSFTGKPVGGNVLLEWTTTSEFNNAFFTIHKGGDSRNLELLTTVPAKGEFKNSNYHYSYTDKFPFENGYYSISQTDQDGRKSDYKAIRVKVNTKESFKGFSYVQQNFIYLKASYATSDNAAVKLFNLDGKLVSSQVILLTKDVGTYKINKPVSRGVYLLRVESHGKELFNKKVFVSE